MTTLHDLQAAAGATFSSVGVPSSFANDAQALDAAQHGVVLHDRSHWGRICVTGADRLRFLHNQTTNSIQTLQSGQGCDTVFVTSTARTIDLVSLYLLDDAVLLLTSPGFNQTLIQWMDRYIFFADKVELSDITASTIAFGLIGPGSDALLQQLGADAIVGQPFAHHHLFTLADIEVRVAVGSGLVSPGYTLIASADQAAALWRQLSTAGAVPMGEQLWERLRVEQGRPTPHHELTDEFNPLEAGLWQTISLEKGCYIGQETIARLHTYRGVKQQLWGIRLDAPAPEETPVVAEGEKIGKLTSCVPTERGYIGLVYVRTKAVAAGLKVQVGESTGELVAVPFVSHEYL